MLYLHALYLYLMILKHMYMNTHAHTHNNIWLCNGHFMSTCKSLLSAFTLMLYKSHYGILTKTQQKCQEHVAE